jgi:hypothetical protein
MKYCRSCENIISLLNVKFCPYCGAKTIKKFDLKDFIPLEDIVIVFKFQNKKAFKGIYENVKELLGISEIGSGREKYCFASSSINYAYQLFDTLAKLLFENEYFIYENGKKLRSINDLQAARVCCAKRSANEIPEYYCFGVTAPNGDLTPNLVGCLQMGLDISPYANLYREGEWQDIFGNYMFSKERIVSKTNELVKRFRFCPFVNRDVIQKFVELWPEKVNVHLDNIWEFWPPKTDSFSEGLKELGLISKTNLKENYAPEFPLVTDTTYFVDLAKKLYPDDVPTNTRAAIYASINAIQMNLFREYS